MTGNEDGVRILEEMHKQHPSPAEIGRRFVKALSNMREVRAVGIVAFGQAFRVITVIDEFDINVWEQIYAQEAHLYELYPELEAEFLVVEQGDQEAVLVSGGIGQDFVWTKQQS